MSWGWMVAMFSGRQVDLSALAWVGHQHSDIHTSARAHTHAHTHITRTHCRRVVRAAPTQRRRVRSHRPGILCIGACVLSYKARMTFALRQAPYRHMGNHSLFFV